LKRVRPTKEVEGGRRREEGGGGRWKVVEGGRRGWRGGGRWRGLVEVEAGHTKESAKPKIGNFYVPFRKSQNIPEM
jgi:hypothetical protein